MLRSLSSFHRSLSKSPSPQNSIEFILNGKKVVIPEGEYDPTKSFGTWLRTDKVNLKGTKIVCEDGGCGACTVVLTQYDPITNKYVHRPVNSCLMPLGQAHGQSITTIEHLGNKEKGLHPIQKSFVKHHAIQCGYCTPGFIMNTYSMLLDNPKPTWSQIEERFDGNLCRCTGYRAIHDALKGFSVDGKESDSLISNDSECQTYVCPDPEHPPAEVKPLGISYKGVHFYVPTSFEQLVELKKNYPNSEMIVGSSEVGIALKSNGGPTHPVYISLHQVKELSYVEVKDNKLIFGASTCLQDLLDLCTRLRPTLSESQNRLFRELRLRLATFSSTQIRNTASVVGNIASGGAVTDMSNFLMANNAVFTVLDVSTGKETQMTMDNFYQGYRKTCLKNTDIVTKFEIPLCEEDEHVFVHKQAHRREDDICIGSATMRAKVNKNNTIEKISLAYSGLAAYPKYARKTEAFLLGKEFTLENIRKAFQTLEEDFPIADITPGGHEEFRRQLRSSFLFRFFHQVEKERGRNYDKSATEIIPRLNSEFGPQSNIKHNGCECKRTYKSVTEPIHSRTSEQMSTGEALYTIDLPDPGRTLYGGIVRSTIAHGNIKKADYSKCLEVPGVIDVVTYKDVQGNNIVGDVINDEPVYAEKEVQFVGQSIALVLAVDNETAWRAAKLAEIEYEELPSVLTIEEAIKHKSFYDIHHAIKTGDPESAFKKCKHVVEGVTEIGGQEHFYLETQNCIVEPGEDKKLKITSSTQAPSTNQVQAARATGLKMKDVDCDTLRIGGGFGGKETRATMQSNMASVAALKHKRPIRIVLDRATDFEVSGGRHPMICKYKVGFDENGKIDALWADIYADCGWSVDISIAVTDRSLFHIDGAYNIPNFYTTCYLCKTNLPTNTAFRGFGAPQAAFFADEILDKVASVVKRPPEDVRLQNMYKEGDKTHFGSPLIDNKLQECWDYVNKSFNFDKFRQEVDEFNRKNKYKKRGVAMTPMKYGISFTFGPLNQAGSLVHVYKDGSILATHAGIDMGQGLNTKLIQIIADTLRVPYDKIRIDTTNTNKVANTSPTAASSGTDLNGWSLYNACVQINQRLDKYRTPDRTFEQAVIAAYLDKVDLSAHGFYATPGICWDFETCKGNPFAYYVYGAGASMVEIDLLTGDHIVHRADIVYDVGKTINSAIDIGQIEGAFAQGYGLLTMEELVHGDHEKNTWIKPGYLRTNNIGYYKIPGFNDVPGIFNASLLPGSTNKQGIYSSKAIGEPPLILASAVGMAIKDAMKAARKENGHEEFFDLTYPLTADRIRVISGVKI
ncbi:aldehyde oxidase and xanthine dehydrogenase [Tritrichomonas foetus]|uniref:Aldehyde oxidase and xanthine dehydrogenase n=1 Tax=Tritrichomonas foetus TaxID=1144522 RepID=A0A1J4KSP0_9EUKA|nr:aldehyde oxidase and xanthine dehydrogenase [Tritrichomonas foetus]|eukprot:OHT14122.1 aldehyde oxidase and xanthine dehydrogenase [Tritrichomonas foetus]